MRYRRTRDIIIELTSLLDVVMILIFAAMIYNTELLNESRGELAITKGDLKEAEEKLVEMKGISEELENALAKLEEGEVEELLQQIQSVESQLDAYEYMDDIVVVFNVSLENKYNNTERCLTYGIASGEEDNKYFSVKRKDVGEWRQAVSTLKMDLQEFLKAELENSPKDKYIYLVFFVDDDKVYNNDFNDIDNALKVAESKYNDGRVRYRLQKKSEEE